MKLSALDFFRKVPKDLSQGTKLGGSLSILAVILLGLLIVLETRDFLEGATTAEIILDDANQDSKIRIDFSIRLLDLPCAFASVDVYDYLGTSEIDVEKTLVKRTLDGEVPMAVHRDVEVKHEDHDEAALQNQLGSYECPKLTAINFEATLKTTPYAFVNFFAPWCIWCQRLAPAWELVALKYVNSRDISIFKVDCVADRELCMKQNIKGFPTLRFFKMGAAQLPDYHGDRTVEKLSQAIEQFAGQSSNSNAVFVADPVRLVKKNRDAVTEGCHIQGYLYVNRVPGQVKIHAKSGFHEFDPSLTNISHKIDYLSFGGMSSKSQRNVPKSVAKNLSPLRERAFISEAAHTSAEHYLKVVSTYFSYNQDKVFQMTTSNHMFQSTSTVPTICFSYDLSPTAVNIVKGGRTWYEFLIHMCAIVGGVFTVVSLTDKTLHGIIKLAKKDRQGKLQ